MAGKRIVGGTLAAVAAAAVSIASALVFQWEGERYTAYQDGGGTWTICDGHTKGVKRGDVATKAQCDAWRAEDIGDANADIDRCITTALNANERAALIDATVNLGPRVVCDSTLRKRANAGDHVGMCNELLRWDHIGDQQVNGLTKRRQAERELCLRADFSNVEGGVS